MRGLLCSAAVATAALFPTTLTSQRDHAAGYGRTDLRPINLDAPNTLKGPTYAALGCAFLNDEIFISNRDDPLGNSTNHFVYVYDLSGVIVRAWPQSSAAQSSSWGYRDGANDGKFLFFGHEQGIECMDINGTPSTVYIAANGPQPMPASGLIYSAAFGRNHRAVAFDRWGNNGNGSFWVADFVSDIVEIDSAGNVLTTLTNQGWSAYGLARDPVTGNLWVNSMPNGGKVLAEIDPRNGMPTGETIEHETPAGTNQGGLDIVPDCSGIRIGGGGTNLLAVSQGSPDTATLVRLHRWNTILGYEELNLLGGTSGISSQPPSDSARRPLLVNDSMDIVLSGTARSPDIAVVWINIDALHMGLQGATPNGMIPPPLFPELNEFVARDQFTLPPARAVTFNTSVANGKVSIPTAGRGFRRGDIIRLQVLYLDPAVPRGTTLMASNQIFYDLIDPGVRFRSDGANSWNAGTTSGFFQIKNNHGSETITRIVLDWSTSSNSQQATMVFDTDQTGMSHVFDAGNSTAVDCTGTYRNGSEIACGLVFGAANTVGSSTCVKSAGSYSGAIFTPGNSKTVEFQFTNFGPGKLFEVDIDTDAGQGTSGGDMVGLVCEYWTASGLHVRGQLVQVSPQRCEINL